MDQTSPRIQATKLDKAPQIDGVLAESEWGQATHLSGFTDPFTGKPTLDLTETWIGYTSDAIYAAFYAHDSKPNEIVGRGIQPGIDFEGEDVVQFRINPYGNRGYDGRSIFVVNVLNTQSDQIAGGRAAKREWRGEWQSGVKRVADGYTVEMRIPWKVLNYPGGKGLPMDIEFVRVHARLHSASRWANGSVSDRPESSGIWLGVDPPAKDERKKTDFLAYTAPELDHGNFTLRSGLDVRHHFTPLLTGLASFNPDFRNIESQIAGIDFTHTERYLDEARPFFNEGGGFFDLTGEFTFGRMFYSRRIENFDYGAKFYGQATPSLSVGALATVDTRNETAAVVKTSKTFGPKADASMFASFREHAGVQNRVFGGTASARRGSFGIDTQLAAEADEGTRTDTAGAFSLAYDVPRTFSVLRYEWIEPNFAPPLAYIPWTDRKGAYCYTEFTNEFRTGPIQNYDVNFFATNFRTYEDTEQQKGIDSYASVVLRNDIKLNYDNICTRYEGLLDSLNGYGITFNQSNRFRRYGMSYEAGTRAGEPSRYFTFDASYRMFKKLDLGLNQSVLNLDGSDRLTIVTLGCEFSPTRAITGRFVQRNGMTNAYLALRNGGSSGTELYVIFGDPNADKTMGRVSVKLVKAF